MARGGSDRPAVRLRRRRCLLFDGGSRCADVDYYKPPCGTVTASQVFAGGLSYRAKPCPEGRVGTDRASSNHWLPSPRLPVVW
ncbi:hypothetical protein NOCARDAX2BIS_520128 [Nocardioides sp. AX2bis]|nr:hypothetical protein NOCARDAX2BIS_520128 [Nocardioides sp. AX2bis]